MDKITTIRAISRSLAVLQAVNRTGSICMNDIAQAAGIPYPTACRIVQTLVSEGMLRRDERTKHYHATAMVQSLSCGFNDHGRVVLRAERPAAQLTEDILWPALVMSRVGGQMVVRCSTTHLTSLSFNNFEPGFTMPLTATAAGRAYLAHASVEERRGITKGLRLTTGTGIGSLDEDLLDHRLEEVRRLGFAAQTSNDLPCMDGRRTFTIAAPFFIDGQIHGAVMLIIFSAAMSLTAAVERYAAKLIGTAETISGSFEARFAA